MAHGPSYDNHNIAQPPLKPRHSFSCHSCVSRDHEMENSPDIIPEPKVLISYFSCYWSWAILYIFHLKGTPWQQKFKN